MAALTTLVLASGWQALAAAPAGQYAVSSGTVVDRRTQLVWQRAPSTTRRSQTAAATYCNTLETGVAWRLPTVAELLTLVDVKATTAPVIDATAFPATASAQYWTSSVYKDPGVTGSSWAVDFNTGVANGISTATTTLAVRCVH
jgi:hypothetical protein